MQQILLQLQFEDEKMKISSPRLASYLQGVLMETIDTEYAEYLHHQSFNPYSIHVYWEKNVYYWKINLLTEEAMIKIGEPLLATSFNSFKLRSLDNQKMNIVRKSMVERTSKDLSDIFYSNYPPKRVEIKFDSATSFKQAGQFMIYPDLRLIFQSLLMRYHHFFEKEEMDSEILNEILSCVHVTSYQLGSSYYPIHRVRIPSFRGKLRIRLDTNDTLRNYIYMLLKFGEYSGVGVKTSMGMGSIRVTAK